MRVRKLSESSPILQGYKIRREMTLLNMENYATINDGICGF